MSGGLAPGGSVPGGYLPVGAPAGGRPHGVVAVGVALILTGVVNFACAAVWMAAGLSTLHDEVNSSSALGASDAFAYTVVMSPVISVFLAPATISGGAQLIRGRTRGLVMLGVIAAIVPLSSCCYLAGLPVGIWALMAVRRPEVRAWFDQGGGTGQPQPRFHQPWG